LPSPNTAGGKILLGVRDDGTVKGIPDTNELRARIQDIALKCDPSVKILIERVGEVTAIIVKESNAKPVQCSDGFFWRQGSVSQKLSREEIRSFFQQNEAIRFDLSVTPVSVTLRTLILTNFMTGFQRVPLQKVALLRTYWSILKLLKDRAAECSSEMPGFCSLQRNQGIFSTRHT
jgi:predicted HTH transcriptional regulator